MLPIAITHIGEVVRCAPGESADCEFTVSNSSEELIELSLIVHKESNALPEGAAAEIVTAIDGRLQAHQSGRVTVRVTMPDRAAAGSYTFKLQAYDTRDTERASTSPPFTLEVLATPDEETEEKKPPRRWWPIAVAVAVVLLVLAGVLTYVFWPSPELPVLVWGEGSWNNANWQ